jgi:hypothetical protein
MEDNTNSTYTTDTPQYNQQPPTQPPAAPTPKGISKGLFITVATCSACTFIGLVLTLGFTIFSTVRSNNANTSLTKEITLLKKTVADQASTIEYIDEANAQFWIASDMHGSGVTDNFITTNVLFCANDVVMLDVDVQPAFSSKYSGEGKFNIGNDELKADLNEYIQRFEKSYSSSKLPGMVNFAALEVRVSIMGYELGTLKNGQLALANK